MYPKQSLQEQEELNKRTQELNQYNRKKEAITSYILEKNSKVSVKEAESYAVDIIGASKKFPSVKHTILTGLVDSECSFKKGVKHNAMSSKHIAVKGMTGVSAKYWTKPLIKAGIITCAKDLENPHKAIYAGAYVLDYYNKQNTTTLAALTEYKGKCERGECQARSVIKKAQSLKNRESQLV